MHDNTIILLSTIGVIAILCQWFAWWIKLPAIVLLLLAGIVLGPVTGVLDPDALFGELLFPLVSLSVAIILFEGSLTLKFEEIRGLQKAVRNILTIGVSLTWMLITVVTHYALQFSWSLSLLFGALMVVTGPTVIVPMLRTVRPNRNIANILRWEGIVIDPMGAILAILVYEVIHTLQMHGHTSLIHILSLFSQTLLTGIIIGGLFGYLLGVILRRHLLPEYLHNVATLTLVFGAFALSNTLSEESGLLTVTVMGIWLANMKDVPIEEILDFKESLSILLISGLFILLAARLDFSQFAALGMGALWVFIMIQFIIRPIKIFVSTIGSDLSWREKLMISWIGPRGIVAAAVSALFALRLQQSGVAQAELLVPLSFTIIIGTVLLQGATARWMAKKLGVAEPDDSGFLIVGANPVALAIAKALTEHGFFTRVTDTNWNYIRTARMEGLASYYGNPVSEHADRHLDLIGLGNLLALSPHSELNALAGLRFAAEFGKQHIYTLASNKENNEESISRKTVSHHYKTLFGQDVTYAKLASLIAQNAVIKPTTLSDNFSFDDYQQQYGKRAIPLFALDEKQRIHFFTAEDTLILEAGWTIVALVQEDESQSAPDATPHS